MHVYIIQSEHYYKVGLANDPVQRLGELQVGNPIELILKRAICFQNRKVAIMVEKYVHNALKPFSVRGEWFNCEYAKIELTLTNAVKRLESPSTVLRQRKTKYKFNPSMDATRVLRYKEILESEEQTVTIDEKNLKVLMTRGCGMPRDLCNLFAVKFPLKRGWRHKVYGQEISRTEFLANVDPVIKAHVGWFD